MRNFRVIPEIKRVAAPGDILMRIFANHSTFPGQTIAGDPNITHTRLVNVSTFPGQRITTGDEVNLLFPLLINVSIVHDQTVAEVPPDGNISMTLLTNVSTFGDQEFNEAPPDANLRMTIFTNVST